VGVQAGVRLALHHHEREVGRPRQIEDGAAPLVVDEPARLRRDGVAGPDESPDRSERLARREAEPSHLVAQAERLGRGEEDMQPRNVGPVGEGDARAEPPRRRVEHAQ
jgi:hypothetical protein